MTYRFSNKIKYSYAECRSSEAKKKFKYSLLKVSIFLKDKYLNVVHFFLKSTWFKYSLGHLSLALSSNRNLLLYFKKQSNINIFIIMHQKWSVWCVLQRFDLKASFWWLQWVIECIQVTNSILINWQKESEREVNERLDESIVQLPLLFR